MGSTCSDRQTWLTQLARTEPLLVGRLQELFAEHDRLEDSGFLDGSASQNTELIALFATSLVGKNAGAHVIERLPGAAAWAKSGSRPAATDGLKAVSSFIATSSLQTCWSHAMAP